MRACAFIAAACCALLVSSEARAKGHAPKGVACIDSYGTVIDDVASASDCKKLGARWGKPGTKSLPKDTSAKSAGSSRHGKKRKVASE